MLFTDKLLVTILNSEFLRVAIERYQAQGQWGARHFDKVPFNMPIPEFDAGNTLHAELVAAAEQAERVAVGVPLRPNAYFVTARREIRAALHDSGVAEEIDGLVERLLRPFLTISIRKPAARKPRATRRRKNSKNQQTLI